MMARVPGDMNNSKSGLVGILSFLALTAASLGILGVASRSADASPAVSAAPHGVVRDAGEPTTVTTIDEVVVAPRKPAVRRAAPRAVAAPAITASSDVCYTRAFHDGNDTSVRTCTPADMLGQ
jgi:hypothetical protein